MTKSVMVTDESLMLVRCGLDADFGRKGPRAYLREDEVGWQLTPYSRRYR